MIKIEMDTTIWTNIEREHQSWWINHLKNQDFNEIFSKLEDDEIKILLKILNNFIEISDFETCKINLRSNPEEIETILPNIKKFIINKELKKNLKDLESERKFNLFFNNFVDKDFIKFVNDIMDQKNKEQLLKMNWGAHYNNKIKSNENFKILLYILSDGHFSVTDEIEMINALTTAKKIKIYIKEKVYDPSFPSVLDVWGKNQMKDKIKNLSANSCPELKNIKIKLNLIEAPLIVECKKIFNYEEFQKSESPTWGRHKLLVEMGIEVCPYCQRNYISQYKEKENKTTADLDHFYSQNEYPFLSLCLYNFIPSCQICNRNFKGAISAYEKNILYPYKESFDDFGVKFILNNSIKNILDNKKEFYVDFTLNGSDKLPQNVENTVNTFKLNKVYKTAHNKYIKSLLDNIEKYPETQINSITDIFKETDAKIEKCLKKKLEDIIKKPYFDRVSQKEPLAKLTADILEFLMNQKS